VVGTDLGLGVVTRTPVEAQAALQLDLLQMEQAIVAGDANQAFNLYQVGLNSLQYDKQGNELPNKRSLSSLSTCVDVRKHVTFAVQSYGLANGNLSTVSTHYLYADHFFKSMFAEARTCDKTQTAFLCCCRIFDIQKVPACSIDLPNIAY
jgi:hypothetical protein